MTSYFTDLNDREVIDIHTGLRLGFVSDLEFDSQTGQLTALITPGRARFFGLLGREDDYVLPWDSIKRLGQDIILIESAEPLKRRPAKRLF